MVRIYLDNCCYNRPFDDRFNIKSEIRRIGTEALIKALGPIGMARFLEEYDGGGTGDYTKEKYGQPDFPIDHILNM